MMQCGKWRELKRLQNIPTTKTMMISDTEYKHVFLQSMEKIISASRSNRMPTRTPAREVRRRYVRRQQLSGREEAAKRSGSQWEEDTWRVWEAEWGNAVVSSISHLNTDREHVSHKSGHVREERGRKYKIYNESKQMAQPAGPFKTAYNRKQGLMAALRT